MNLFDAAQRRVQAMMEADCVPRFFQSNFYKSNIESLSKSSKSKVRSQSLNVAGSSVYEASTAGPSGESSRAHFSQLEEKKKGRSRLFSDPFSFRFKSSEESGDEAKSKSKGKCKKVKSKKNDDDSEVELKEGQKSSESVKIKKESSPESWKRLFLKRKSLETKAKQELIESLVHPRLINEPKPQAEEPKIKIFDLSQLTRSRTRSDVEEQPSTSGLSVIKSFFTRSRASSKSSASKSSLSKTSATSSKSSLSHQTETASPKGEEEGTTESRKGKEKTGFYKKKESDV